MTGVAIAVNADAGSPAYAAGAWRQAAAVALQYGGRAVGARQGVRPGGDQLLTTLVSTTITVKAGVAVIDPALTTTQGPYWVALSTDETHTLTAADATNPRKDITILRVYDDDEDSSGLRTAQSEYLVGTPNPSPVEPTVPPGAIRLATIDVPASGGGSPVVTDRRVSYLAGPELAKFTANGTFTKANFPWARRIRVRLVAGGGAGGGAPVTAAGEGAEGGGGGGGGYAERWLDIWQLAANETVTVGAGGVGGTGTGGTGGTSSFGSLVAAAGGAGGLVGTATSGDNNITFGAGGAGTTGDLLISGQPGEEGNVRAGNCTFHNVGGNSQLGAGAPVVHSFGANGTAGQLYGGGGSGARNEGSGGSIRSGGNGAAGIVIVEIY